MKALILHEKSSKQKKKDPFSAFTRVLMRSTLLIDVFLKVSRVKPSNFYLWRQRGGIRIVSIAKDSGRCLEKEAG